MGFLGEWFNLNKKGKSNGGIGVSKPLRMQFNIVGPGQVTWSLLNGENFLENGYLGNHAIFSIQDWKSQKCAMAPSIIYEKKDSKVFKQYKSFLTNSTPDSFLRARDIKHKALRELEDHEMQNVLDFPNPGMSRFEFDYGLTTYIDQTGNGFIFGVRDGLDGTTGKIKEMYLPPAQDVKWIREGYYITEYYQNSSATIRIDAKNVCHIRNFNPSLIKNGYDSFSGLSRLHSLSHLIDTYNESIETEASIYKDKGVRTIVFPKGQLDVNDMSVEGGMSQRDRFNQQVKETGSGGIITSKVEMGSITLGYSPKELGILESKGLTKIDFCAAYHIPPEIFGWGGHSAYENLAENKKIALNDAVLPEYEKKANALNLWLTPSYDPDGKQGIYIGYNYDVFNELHPNKKELADWMKLVPMTPNETREALGYQALKDENADKIIISGNYKLLEDMGMESFAGGGADPFGSDQNA